MINGKCSAEVSPSASNGSSASACFNGESDARHRRNGAGIPATIERTVGTR